MVKGRRVVKWTVTSPCSRLHGLGCPRPTSSLFHKTCGKEVAALVVVEVAVVSSSLAVDRVVQGNPLFTTYFSVFRRARRI